MRVNETPATPLATTKLRAASQRATAARVAVLATLIEQGGHSSAEEVLALSQARLPELTRSTVYRTLERLRDVRIVSETDLGGGVRHFEVIEAVPHHHLVCTGCGVIIELADQSVESLRREIERAHGFQPAIDHLAVFGRCARCQ